MKHRTTLIRLGQVLLIVVVSYGIVRALAPELDKLSIEELARWRPRIGVLLLSQVLAVGFFLYHAALWRNILTRLAGRQPGINATLRMFFLSGLGRYIPGRLWQIAGLALLARRAGFSAVTATAAVLVGQFAFLTTGLAFLVLLLPGWGGRAPLIAAISTTAAGAGVFLLVTSTKRGRNFREKLVKRSERFGNALLVLDRVAIKDALAWWLGYFLSWVLLGTAFVVLVYSFVPLGKADIMHVAGTIAASYLAGYIAFFSVNGLGIREAVMLGLLSHVMPVSAALLVSVVSRLWLTAAELLPLALIPIVKKENIVSE